MSYNIERIELLERLYYIVRDGRAHVDRFKALENPTVEQAEAAYEEMERFNQEIILVLAALKEMEHA